MVSPILPTWEMLGDLFIFRCSILGNILQVAAFMYPAFALYGTIKITDCIYLLLQMKQQRQSGHRVVGGENMEESYASYLGKGLTNSHY